MTTFLKRNLSKVDRAIRGLIGVSVLVFVLFFGDFIGDPLINGLLIFFGVLNLISFVTTWCPVYHLANISTYKSK